MYSRMTTDQMREALRQHIARGLVAAATPPVTGMSTPMETVFTGAKVFADADGNGKNARVLDQPKGEPAPELKRTKAKPVVKPERETRNGIKRPLDPNSKCGQVWVALDDLVAKGEPDLTTAIHAIGEKRGWSRNNVSCELSAFRKFMGLGAREEAA
jgi:hypothetical protein